MTLRNCQVLKLFPKEGYGFIETPDGREIYFHRSSVLNSAFEHLEIGDRGDLLGTGSG